MTRKKTLSRHFDGVMYLKKYYENSSESGEGAEQMSLMVKATKNLKPGARVLDLASGPTIYQIIPAARRAGSITLSDVSPSLLGISEQWRDNKGNAFDWDPYFKKVLDLESVQGIKSGDTVAERKEKVRRVVDFAVIDINETGQTTFKKPFDLVQNVFLASCAATSRRNFAQIWKKCVDYAVPGGDVMLIEVCDADRYFVGNTSVYAHKISYDDQVRLVETLGCAVLTKALIPADAKGADGYSGLSFFHLRKPFSDRGRERTTSVLSVLFVGLYLMVILFFVARITRYGPSL